MAEFIRGPKYETQRRQVATFKDAKLIRNVRVGFTSGPERRHTLVTIADTEGNDIYALDCVQPGYDYVEDISVELSSFDGRVVFILGCFKVGEGTGEVVKVRTDYFARPEIRFGEA